MSIRFVVATTLLLGAAGVSRAQNLEVRPRLQTSLRAAGRFLEQATFGPRRAEVFHLQRVGFESWLDDQFALSESPIPDAPEGTKNLVPVQQSFFYNAITGPDQLRQRVAFALSQIWVVSGSKVGRPEAFIPYLRLLEKDAFANYYDLIYDITLNPAMGNYLDMVNNDKPAPGSGKRANENYARELLQLFTIGLVQLNDDGTQRVDAAGNPIPTYDQQTIEAFARVLTGWTYPPAPGATSRVHNPPLWEGPMVAFASNHDMDSKTLLNGVALPMQQSPERDLSDALHNIFNHPNVGPFIGKQLIQHLVTSNPSPAYVSRVTAAFNDNGAGVRGDMKAVIRAILLDPEARQYDDAPPPAVNEYGHLREPVLFITSLLRAIGASVPAGNSLASFAGSMSQNVFYAPSVFNYFAPSYRIPGTEVLGPEFQLLSPSNATARVNFLNRLFFGTLGDGTTLDLVLFIAAASNPERLLNLMDATLFHQSMPAQVRASILKAISATTDNPTRAKTALYLAASSGQYQVEQ